MSKENIYREVFQRISNELQEHAELRDALDAPEIPGILLSTPEPPAKGGSRRGAEYRVASTGDIWVKILQTAPYNDIIDTGRIPRREKPTQEMIDLALEKHILGIIKAFEEEKLEPEQVEMLFKRGKSRLLQEQRVHEAYVRQQNGVPSSLSTSLLKDLEEVKSVNELNVSDAKV